MFALQPQPASSIFPITRPCFDDQEAEAVREVLESGGTTPGFTTGEFEQTFARRHQVAHARATSSGTAALHLAVLALDLGPGDEVIVPAFASISSAHCAEYAGARAVFCDIDPITFCMNPAAVEAAITPRTRAIVAVHLFGLAADLKALTRIAKRHKLHIIENAACAVGAEYQGKPAGSLGDLACFSLNSHRVITTGEGGIVTTQRKELADRIAALRNHGVNRKETSVPSKPSQVEAFDSLGFSLRLSDIQAAIGLVQMAKLEPLLAHRRDCALGYSRRLAGLDWLRLPAEPKKCRHTFQSYAVWVEDHAPASRNQIMEYLANRGIQTRPGALAVHCTGYYREKYGLAPEQFPHARAAAERTITLPIFPGMSDADLDYIAEALRSMAHLPGPLRKVG